MRWKGREGSGNVSTSSGGKGLAIGGVGVVVLLIYTLLTGDPSALLNNLFNNGNTSKLSEVGRIEGYGDGMDGCVRAIRRGV
jgi:predicted metalloprotease